MKIVKLPLACHVIGEQVLFCNKVSLEREFNAWYESFFFRKMKILKIEVRKNMTNELHKYQKRVLIIIVCYRTPMKRREQSRAWLCAGRKSTWRASSNTKSAFPSAGSMAASADARRPNSLALLRDVGPRSLPNSCSSFSGTPRVTQTTRD